MAEVITSTGFKNILAKKGIKEALTGYIINIYSGTPPASADDAETGQKLVTITTDGASWTASTAQEDYFAITAVGSDGDTLTVTITPPSGTPETFTFTKTSAFTTTDDIAREVVRLINEGSNIVRAVAATETTESAVILVSLFPGDGYTVNVAVTGTLAASPTGDLTPIVANSKGKGLHFEYLAGVSGGILEKASGDTWKGTVAISGAASWFRIQTNDDTGASSTTAVRIQGNCSTSSDAPLQLAGTLSLTQGAAITIDTFSIQLTE